MAEIDHTESPSRFKLGVLAATMIPPSSAPGMLNQYDFVTERMVESQPTGCDHALEYWRGFTPVMSYNNSAVPAALCGSGGDSVLTTLIMNQENDSARNDDIVVPLSHGETIAGIRSALSLQLKELAGILRVQRPTIYSWIKGEAEPSAGNRKRLQQVYRIATQWTRRSKLPAERVVRAAGTDGHSVLELLKADDIDEAGIVRRFKAMAALRMSLKKEADEQRPTAAAIARRHGLTPNDISDQQYLIDAETGKRSLND